MMRSVSPSHSAVAAGADPEFDFSGLGFRVGESAVVTGAAGGIGRSVVTILARSGVSVHAWDIDADGLESLSRDVASSAGPVVCQQVDTAQDDQIAAAWEQTRGLEVQYLVNNAGPPNTTPLSVADGVRQAIGGYASMTDSFLALHGEEAVSIVFTASIAGNLMVSATPDWYPAAKAGVVGYTRHLAVKHRGRPRSNAVAPGGTVTGRTASAFASPAVEQRFANYPMGRPGWAWEVATAICFLLSPAASFVNGVLLPVEGASTWSSHP